MRLIREVWHRLRNSLRRDELDGGVDEEMRFHIDQQTQKNVRAGMEPAQARRAALVEFGGVERHKEAVRDEARPRLLEDLGQDTRYAVRVLRGAPGFTLVAIGTIALGVGAMTAIFSAVNHVLLRPLPFPASERLVVPQARSMEDGSQWNVTYADYEDWQANGVFARAAVYQPVDWNVADEREAERLTGAAVSSDFFATLGMAPTLGRFFVSEEFDPESPRVVVLSYELWQRMFAGDRAIVGKTLRIGGRPRQVVGVAPRGMAFPREAALWAPLRLSPADRPDLERRDNFVFSAIARLKPDEPLRRARAELESIAGRVAREHPVTRKGVTITAVPLIDYVVGEDLPLTLWLLMGAVSLVLAIGCLNVANLLLSRAAGRGRELAVRIALGAGGGRLVRQLLTESLILAVAGGVLGSALAYAGVRALALTAPEGTPRMEELSLDPRALLFALAVSILSAVLFGLAPAIGMARRAVLSPTLGEEDRRSTAGVRGRRVRKALASGEIALSLVLLVGSALLLKSLAQLYSVDPGFQTAGVTTASVVLQGERYDSASASVAAISEILDRVAALPGVRGSAAASALPLGGGGFYLGRSFLADGRPEPPAGAEVSGMWTVVTPGYFSTLRLPVVRGREFTSADRKGATPVAVVNREFARRMFPNEDPIGKRIRSWRDENLLREIVGVTEDVRYMGAGDEIGPLVYVPHAQDTWNSMILVIGTDGPTAPVIRALRSAIAEIDPGLGVSEVQTMEEVFERSVAPQRFTASLLGGFAGVALLLACIGIYGVLAYGVAQRRREFGIRMALGAGTGEIRRMVAREAARITAWGLGFGLALAFAATQGMSALLYGVRPTDGATYLGVCTVLTVVALGASWLPARRASRADPMEALRGE
jgi:putative ABC transport system permease protein